MTLGDPKGIGPEVIQKALKSPALRGKCRFVLFGDPEFFDHRRARMLTPKQCGELSGYYIRQAAAAALKGDIDAIATAPICKEHLRAAGYPYPGHTEFLADLSKTKSFRMMMAGPKLKVVLVTIHEPIRKIPALLNQQNIFETIRLTQAHLSSWFKIKNPRIAVAGLNPHAGEGGMFGSEEKELIAPAVRRSKKKGWNVQGPCPPDTVFYQALHGKFDAVVALYHDQGLIPLKLLHFEDAVNITLGLPFVRTSVDHGTAFDIAGKGIADPSSMVAAIRMAVELSGKK